MIDAALAGVPEIRVVGSVFSGEKALDFLVNNSVDLITLDIEMPGIGGLKTLEAIRQLPNPPGVILVSALTRAGALVTIEGLQRGAFDFLLKPQAPNLQTNEADLRHKLLEKISAFCERRRRLPALSIPIRPPVARPRGRFRAIAIGVSTGGPAALTDLLPVLTRQIQVPIFIVQHNIEGLSSFLAENLQRRCGTRVLEATDGLAVDSGTVYMAPSGRHMMVRSTQGRFEISLNDLPKESGFRPSVDVLFRSLAPIYGSGLITLILTGMGDDGTRGLAAVRRAGGYVIAQDEASSVVWGMPGAAVRAGHVDEILPLSAMPAALVAMVGGSSP